MIAELYRRLKAGEAIIKPTKKKSFRGALSKVKVVSLSSKDGKVEIISHPTEGIQFFVNGKLSF